MVDDSLESWQLLEEIFSIPAVSFDQRILWTYVYLCPVLDFSVWDGPCVLDRACLNLLIVMCVSFRKFGALLCPSLYVMNRRVGHLKEHPAPVRRMEDPILLCK